MSSIPPVSGVLVFLKGVPCGARPFGAPPYELATGGGVQIDNFSLSRLTPPLDNVLPTTTGGGC